MNSKTPRCISATSRRLGRGIWLAALVLLFASPVQGEIRRVVLLQSRDRGSLTFDSFVSSFRAELERASSEPVIFTQFVVNPTGFDDIPNRPSSISSSLRSCTTRGPIW